MTPFRCRDKSLDYGNRTLVMGILNVTPDSFSDGGISSTADDAYNNAVRMIEAGADIIDVGGESTRPGYTRISDEEEIERIVPVIRRLAENHDVVISVDTYKSAVAEAALEAGAHVINDISALEDEKMAYVVRKYNAGLILMYNARNYPCDEKQDITEFASEVLSRKVSDALEAGISKDSIMLDPGIGFGTTREQDASLISNLDRLNGDSELPVLLALSRKRIVAEVMGGQSLPSERDAASIGLGIAGVARGAAALRVHDVENTVNALKGFDYISKGVK